MLLVSGLQQNDAVIYLYICIYIYIHCITLLLKLCFQRILIALKSALNALGQTIAKYKNI